MFKLNELIKLDYLSKLSKLIYFSLLSLGCVYQLYRVCGLYFDYPTNVVIETQFDSIEKPLPAITVCHNIGEWAHGRPSNQVLEEFKIEPIINVSICENEGQVQQDLTQHFWKNRIEFTMLNHYCITFNSILNGNSTFPPL